MRTVRIDSQLEACMTAHNWVELVAKNVQALGEDFRPNELAYLALTSKVELPIRDRLAFRIRQQIRGTTELAVAREWMGTGTKRERFDLAVVTDGSEARLLLEAKAMYSFDLFTSYGRKRFVRYCSNDLRKLQEAGANSPTTPTLLTLVLATHPHHPEAIPLHWSGVVKYFNQVQRFPDRPVSDVTQEILQHFGPPNFPLIVSGEIHGGLAFGTEVSVVYALSGPHNVARSVS